MKQRIVFVVMGAALMPLVWVGCGNGGTGTTNGTGGATSTTHTAASSSTKASSSVSTGPGGAGGSGGGLGGGGAAPMGIQCNPVTNAGCTAGSACDIAGDGNGDITAFICYPPPNDAMICGMCDLTGMSGPFCAGEGTCLPIDQAGMVGECARYCCTDADCGSGTCETMSMGMSLFGSLAPNLGVCAAAAEDAGAADAGASPFACDAPASAPSMGSCVMVQGG